MKMFIEIWIYISGSNKIYTFFFYYFSLKKNVYVVYVLCITIVENCHKHYWGWISWVKKKTNFNDSPRYGTLTRNPFIKVTTMCVAALVWQLKLFILYLLVLLVFIFIKFSKLVKETRVMWREMLTSKNV